MLSISFNEERGQNFYNFYFINCLILQNNDIDSDTAQIKFSLTMLSFKRRC